MTQPTPFTGRLGGKIAVVTGGAAGMGRATALAFAREGAKVSILDIQDAEGEKTAQMIRDAGGEAAYFHADVTKDDQINAALDGAVERFGPYNVLFNHAGSIIVKPLHETTSRYAKSVPVLSVVNISTYPLLASVNFLNVVIVVSTSFGKT